MRDTYKRWFGWARNDLATAEFNFEGEKFDATVDYSHKASEKALMALIIKRSDKAEHFFHYSSISKVLNYHERILKLYALVDIAHTAISHQDKEKEISKDECEEVLRAAMEIVMWVQKELGYT